MSHHGNTVTVKREAVNDYNYASWIPQSSLLDSMGRKTKAAGIKDYAWKGMPSEVDKNHMTHHYDSKFLADDKKRQDSIKSDNLPCGVQDVPKSLYVNSDLRMRRTSDIQRELMREEVFRSEFNKFLNSKEGKHYYHGVIPVKKE